MKSGHLVIDPSQMYKGIGVDNIHFKISWEDRNHFAKSLCAQRRIATVFGVLRAGQKNAPAVMKAALEQQDSPWLQPQNINMPPQQAGQVAAARIKTVLKPPRTMTVRETRCLDYLTGLNPHGESQQPDVAASPSATFRAVERVKREREEFFEQVWLAQEFLHSH